jgi:uncharacterized protein
MKRRMHSRVVSLLVIAATFGGCAVNSQGNYDQMRSMLVQEKYTSAVSFIEGNKEKIYGKDNALLFYMDRLLALHLAKRFKDSNDVINQASDKIEELYTASVSKEVGAVLTNDNVLPYQGEAFEQVLIHVIGALNYIMLGDKDGALVEARRVEEKLTALNEQVLKGAKNEKDEAARQLAQYSEDAFIRWFTGCLFETEGDSQSLNDALVAYKKALSVYEKTYTPKYKTPIPQLLISDLMRTSHALGFHDELKPLQKKYPTVVYPSIADTKDRGEVVFILMNGEAPAKSEKTWETTADGKIIKVAYPVFQTKPKSIAYAIVKIGTSEVKTEVFEDVNAIAIQSLADRIGRVKGKMIGRAIAKFVAAKATQVAVDQAGGGFGGLIGGALSQVNAVTEQADLRSWLLLPSSIDVAKAFVPAGKHPVTVTLHASTGALVRTLKLSDVDVKAGKKAFISLRAF